MAAPLPHTRQIGEWADQYLADAESKFAGLLKSLNGNSAFREIYWNSLGADAVLSKLAAVRWRPHSRSARSLILRIPLLAAVGQSSVAVVELRRLVELTFWTIYFTEHPVEWASFEATPTAGMFPAIDQPIRYCAHRGLKFYLDYGAERLEAEPSGLGSEAVKQIGIVKDELNAVVHPGKLSVSPGRIPPFEGTSDAELRRFAALQQKVFANICLALAATFRKEFNRLPAMHRAQFDRLVGSAIAKRIRSGAFGLP
jgi:hypothetical protein